MSTSIVHYYGAQQSKCGYCGGTKCSMSHGMHAYLLACQDYQDLIDRGWRRCGDYCYKMRNKETCCTAYTIKSNALKFKLSKSQKRVLRRVNRFLRDGKREFKLDAGEGDGEDDACDASGAPEVTVSEPQPQLPDKRPAVINVDQIASLARAQKKPTKLVAAPTSEAPSVEAPTLGSNKSAAPISNKPCKKAKQMRLERRQAKLGDTASTTTKSLSQEKSLRDFLTSDSETNKHQLKLRLVDVNGEEFKRTVSASFALYKKYQISIHNDPPKDQEAYEDHLKQTPIKNEKSLGAPEMGYGSFHQQYWLDDKLIAVGVIDILPSCVSSVYFFYDPDYSFLSLGTYGSLREIDLVQSLAENVPELKYYYMGFYIHSCPKMRYKGKLSASYLLCPETYDWLPLTDAIRSKLDEHKYQRLNADANARDVNEFLMEHLDDVRLLLGVNNFTYYKNYNQLSDSENEMIIEYSKLVGKVCARRMLYVNIV
ncbi:arginyl-tRNA--protein transferase 1 isoform X2 [Drosophila eugracilis]|uniref:arginyl-tRNA--protein transferase 1 isoform X2 n=1 Tax=Drosophila eugracilis TaxID=29029 RepID=UPI0007E83218|nr:arginyl-tRNA--protein transferase 1 isoform X2 [Drosophila eugracilis]